MLSALPSWQGTLAEASIPVQRQVLRPLMEKVMPVWLVRGKYSTEVTWTRLGEMLREMREASKTRTA